MAGVMPLPRLLIPLWYLVLILTVQFCAGALLNGTIDDAFPDPRTGALIAYSPPGAWVDGRYPCTPCTAKPTASGFRNNTWHDNTFNPRPGTNQFTNIPSTATVKFTGSAVYVFCALARTASGPTGNSDMSFSINGTKVGEFILPAPGTEGYDYNVLVYKNTSLPYGEHDFVLQNGRIDGVKSLVLLDRIVYSYDDGTKAASAQHGLGVIIGATLGGVAFLCISIVGLWYWRARRRRERARKNAMAKPAELKSPLEAVPYHLAQPTYTNHYAPSSNSRSLATTSISGVGTTGHQVPVHDQGDTFDPNSLVTGQGSEGPPGYYDPSPEAGPVYHKKR